MRCILETTPTYQSAPTSANRASARGSFPSAPPLARSNASPRARATRIIWCSSIQSSGATPEGRFTRTSGSQSRAGDAPATISHAKRAARRGNFKPCWTQCLTSGAHALLAAVSTAWYLDHASEAHAREQKYPAAPPASPPPCVGTQPSCAMASRCTSGVRQW